MNNYVVSAAALHSCIQTALFCENNFHTFYIAAKRCPLPPIKNGAWQSNEVFVNRQIEFRCNSGYEYTGVSPPVRQTNRLLWCFLNETLEYEPQCTGK